MTERMRKMLTMALVLVFVLSTALLVIHRRDDAAADESYLQAQRIAGLASDDAVEESAGHRELPDILPETAEEPIPAEAEPQMVWVPAAVEPDDYMIKLAQTNLEALREVNPDVIGWVFLPNSKVNYPVVQGQDNQYYLKHTWDDQSRYSGSIFLEATNNQDFSDFRSILYGHNMADMSMFAVLHYYSSQYYVEKNPYVYLVTDEGVLRYEIYSTYRAEVDGPTYALDIQGDALKESFIQMTLEEAAFDLGIEPSVTDRILTLSTCTGNSATRQVVHARLVMVEIEVET